MLCKVFFHDRCFDGAASAALFAEFYRRTQFPGAEFRFVGMSHTNGDPFAGVELDGDDHACVDFRYCADDKMQWWFDHHQSAFQPKSLREHYEDNRREHHYFDPSAQSCANFMAAVFRDKFKFHLEQHGDHWIELLRWADIIDGASFSSAAEAVELAHPALQTMTWLRHNDDPKRTKELIELLGTESFAQIVQHDFIAEPLTEILEGHRRAIAAIESRIEEYQGVASYDLRGSEVGPHNGFISYFLRPECAYSVSLATSPNAAYIAVGHNPWHKETHPRANIASLCEEFGGGGHPQVGGITFSIAEIDRAVSVFDIVCERLRSQS